MRYGIMVLAALFLAGCSMFPDPIATENEDALVSYQSAAENSEQVVGERARWGGVIADVRNGDEMTIVEMVHFPLKSWGRPVVSDDTQGRFLVLVDRFLDPQVYKQGRSLTALGTIRAAQSGKIDDYTYTYPVLEADGVYLWEKPKEKIETGIDYSPLWFRHNFYAPFPYRPYYTPHPVVRPTGNEKDSGTEKQ
ncbi:Slp family lipoprotein [Idiomarina seosinensis]|uniref:Slp family lipoprotein n=1 Tax=Idiomarina seosinensis TaxID=281739 RepID=UPI00384D42AD